MKLVGFFLAGMAVKYSAMRHPVAGMEVAADFWGVLVLVVTLPQARMLWREDDPREIGGELELFGREG